MTHDPELVEVVKEAAFVAGPYAVKILDAIAAYRAAHPDPVETARAWTMERPFRDEEPFLAALLVTNNRLKTQHWEYTILWWSEGQLLFYDAEGDTGWHPEDYTHFKTFDAPLATQARKDKEG
jgi:hypothetical protein